MFEKKLNEIGFFYSGLSGKSKEDFIGNYPDKYIDFVSVFKSSIELETLPSVRVNNDEKQNIVNQNDLIINVTSENIEEVGVCSLYTYETPVYLNSFCKGLRLYDGFDPYYVKYLLSSNKYRKLIIKEAQGVTRINLSTTRMGEIILDIHEPRSQKKIGCFFKEIDDLIDLETQLINELKKFKKSFSDKVFINNNCNKKILDLVDNYGGTSYEPLISDIGKYNVIMLGSIDADGNLLNNNKYINSENVKLSTKLQKDDIVMVLTDKNRECNFIGKCVIVPENDKYVLNQRLERLIPKNNINTMYIKELLSSTKIRNKIKGMAQGAVQVNISFNDIKNIKVELHDNHEIIGMIFQKIDELISLHIEKREKLNELKKYYLNKIFC